MISVPILISSVSSNWKKLKASNSHNSENEVYVNPKNSKGEITNVLAMDCEMVATNEDGSDNVLARVSIVNQRGQCVLDRYVNVEGVTDYRTEITGITEQTMKEFGKPFQEVQKEVSEIIENKILVGHAIHNDLQALLLGHPRRLIRDTQRYKPFRQLFNGSLPSLKKLALKVLDVKIQQDVHDSIIDAKTALQLYMSRRKEWERSLKTPKPEIPGSVKHERYSSRHHHRRDI